MNTQWGPHYREHPLNAARGVVIGTFYGAALWLFVIGGWVAIDSPTLGAGFVVAAAVLAALAVIAGANHA